jgi:uncharacterized protein
MEAPSEPLLWITLLLMLVGLAGSVLPGLPGVPLIFLSALVYAILTDFEYVGTLVVVLLGLFAAIAFVTDFAATTYGARRFGASNWGTLGGAVGGIVGALAGALFFGIGALFGLILGAIGGVFLGEYLRDRRGDRAVEGTQPAPQFGREDWRRTYRAVGGVLVGYLSSTIVQGFLGLAGVILFVLALFN